MRWVMLAALVAVGCGKKPTAVETSAEPPPAPRVVAVEPTRKADPVPAPTKKGKVIETVGPVNFGVIQDAYKVNEFDADSKWRGKRVIVDVREIVKMGREDGKGRPFVAAHHFGHNPEPTGYFFFKDGAEGVLGRLRTGIQSPLFRVAGLCVGRKDDGVNRGIKGYEFVVLFVECEPAR